MHHVFSGIDHVLFIVALLLAKTSFKEIIKVTVTFTIAHSITLVLAALGIISVPSGIVEVFIACSIAYVAWAGVFLPKTHALQKSNSKLAVVFLFGLFHGLGFAGILREISIPSQHVTSSLLFFNIGIEIAQIIIVLYALAFMFLVRDKIWYQKLIQGVAVVIISISLVWVVQRIFGLIL